ncbi:NADPH2:quinone reductase [Nitrosomonas marina]|uniref:NADPH2:quinone reductase n=1 Tax=Nitrosomonas marina TaxID=917 RepID=A0A1I0FDB8_9PROT|nr:zinc-dependent alcohol dehydrogenase family protein [Nitrosomonas marina]SET56157.1 NADPH2:quinone reductase [Nitrosomonas marina]
MMKAVYFEKGGTSEVLQFGERNFPEPCGENQVLVSIKAAGINPVDCKIRAAPDRFPVSYPVIPGCDGAGIVEAVGNNVKTFKPGDSIYFSQPGFNRRQGTYAEYVHVDQALLAKKPESLSYQQAAAAPLVLITAWEALHGRARISAGQTVLIHAGAGGVGHVAIQLAKLAGAHVITTVSSDEKAEFVKRLGADKTINYKLENVSEAVMRWTDDSGVDIALDTVGPSVLQNCFSCVKPYGDVVTILQPAADTDWREARLRNLRFSFELMLTPVMLELDSAMQLQGEILRRCAILMEEGKLTVEIAKTFDLAEAAVAQDYLEKQHPLGKVVLIIEK